MNCSKCRSSNLDEANFCRTCGNIFQKPSTKSLPEVIKPNYEKAIKKLFMSIGFFVIALITFLSDRVFLRDISIWWGIAGLVVLAQSILQALAARRLASSKCLQTAIIPANHIQETFVSLNLDSQITPTGEMVAPPSVTERTTELFDKQER